MSPQRFKCSECTNWTVESPDKSICDECLGRMAISGSSPIVTGEAFEDPVPVGYVLSQPAERSLFRDITKLNSEKNRVEAAWIAVAIADWNKLEATTGRLASEWAKIAAELESHWCSLK